MTTLEETMDKLIKVVNALDARLAKLDEQVQLLDEWRTEFVRGALEAEQELQALFEGDTLTHIEFIPSLAEVIRDKKKDH